MFSQIVKNLYAEQGLRGFFKGFVCLSMRDWPFMILLFTSYESLNHFESTVMKGGIAGAFAGFLTSPMDAIKTQLMLRKNPNDGIRETCMKMNLFKGAWMRTVWWFGVCSIFFPVYEHCKRLGSAYNVQIPIPLTSS
jgi:solute carrier family 25 S-adenosylmethionine transporter 26